MKINLLILLFMTTLSTSLRGQAISEEFPYTSKYITVGDAKLHYIDEGTGDPIIFLHGIPMSLYSWRNIIPHLSDTARCLAMDFMGFGKSDKPAIDYSFEDQVRYLSAFIEAMELTNITFVMTDIGGIIGTHYAVNHPDKVKALVLMETPIADARTFHKHGGMMQHMMFWMGGKDKMGYRMFVKKNMFLKMMSMLIKRKLTDVEKAYYRAPFTTEASRIPLFTLVNAFPRKGKNPQPGDMADFLTQNDSSLRASSLPKLLLYAKPGMLINKKALTWAKEHLPHLTTQFCRQGQTPDGRRPST